MTFRLLTYLSVITLLSCSRQPSNDQAKTVDTVTVENSFGFPLTNPGRITSSSHSEISLDSTQRKMWTDKIVPTPYYNATGLATFDKVNGFDLVAIETMADDWSKSFLLTVDGKGGLVDFVEITDDYGDATQDEKGNETVVGTNMRTEFLTSSSIFTRTRINETIYNYQQSNELAEKDSIVEKFQIDNQGRFKKLTRDSIRIRE